MIKGTKAAIEAIEKEVTMNKSDLIMIPNVAKNKDADKPIFRVLADAVIFDVHQMYSSPEYDEIKIKYGRTWDFCVEDLNSAGKCKHCKDYIESAAMGKATAIKKLSKRFIYPVLVRPTSYTKSDKTVVQLGTRVGYIDISPTAAKGLEDFVDDLRKTYGDDPNQYLPAEDLYIWRNDKETNFKNLRTPSPLTDADKKLICEYFGIDEYTPEKVFDKMVEVWEEKEQEAITRLTVTTNTSIDTDDGEIPEFLGDDEDDEEV